MNVSVYPDDLKNFLVFLLSKSTLRFQDTLENLQKLVVGYSFECMPLDRALDLYTDVKSRDKNSEMTEQLDALKTLIDDTVKSNNVIECGTYRLIIASQNLLTEIRNLLEMVPLYTESSLATYYMALMFEPRLYYYVMDFQFMETIKMLDKSDLKLSPESYAEAQELVALTQSL